MDEADNDPVRFWSYVIAALQTVQPHLGKTALYALQAPAWAMPTRTPGIEHLLVNLINELEVLPEPLLFVLVLLGVNTTTEIGSFFVE